MSGTKIIVIAILVLAGSCRMAPPQQLPELKPLPAAFTEQPGDSSIAAIHWKQYFNDSRLVALIDSAISNNQDMLIAFQHLEQAKARIGYARAALAPEVRATITASGDHYGKYTMTGVGNFDTNKSQNIEEKQKTAEGFTPDYFIGLRSSWEVDIWGKLKDQKKAALSSYLAAGEGRKLVQTELVATIANLYYDLLALDNELKIIHKNTFLQESALEVVKVQKEAGRATELAVQQFEAQLLRTRALAYGVLQQVKATENELNFLSGRYAAAVQRDSIRMLDVSGVRLPVGAPLTLLENRADIREAKLQWDAAAYQTSAAGKAFLPALQLTPYAGLNAFRASVLFDPGSVVYGIFGGLTAPIFNRQQLKADRAITVAAQKIAILEYQKRLLNAFREITTLHSAVENVKQAYEIKQQEVALLNKAVNTARELYYTGYANYLEVISAQRGVLDAELELTGLRRDLLKASVDLYRALGGGWREATN
ncbi:MAG: efflux transporter outer membrane subunit [Flavihumibacter sp.]